MGPFTFITLLFAALSALYALVLYYEKDVTLIPKFFTMEYKNRKEYTKRFAWMILFIAGAFALGSLLSLINIWAGVIALILGLAAAIIIGWRFLKQVM